MPWALSVGLIDERREPGGLGVELGGQRGLERRVRNIVLQIGQREDGFPAHDPLLRRGLPGLDMGLDATAAGDQRVADLAVHAVADRHRVGGL